MITVIAEIKVNPATAPPCYKPLKTGAAGAGGRRLRRIHADGRQPHPCPLAETVAGLGVYAGKWQSQSHLEKHLQIEHMLKHRETIKDYVLGTEIYVLENAL